MVKKTQDTNRLKIVIIVISSLLGSLIFLVLLYVILVTFLYNHSASIEVINDTSKPVMLMDCDTFKDMDILQPSEKGTLGAVANRPTFSCRVFDATQDDYVYIGCLHTPTASAHSDATFNVSAMKSDVPQSSCGQ